MYPFASAIAGGGVAIRLGHLLRAVGTRLPGRKVDQGAAAAATARVVRTAAAWWWSEQRSALADRVTATAEAFGAALVAPWLHVSPSPSPHPSVHDRPCSAQSFRTFNHGFGG